MAVSTSTSDSTLQESATRTSWLERPLSNYWCALGWLIATLEFVGLTRILGGPTGADESLSAPSTWAFAHGAPACAYASGSPGVPPLYPAVSGALAWFLRIGHEVPYPSAPLGAHCATVDAIGIWANRSDAHSATVLLGFSGWFVLLAGVVILLRATGRGRRGWEVAAAIVLGCVPPVFMALQEYFHPEDFMAIGLAFAGVACVRRGQWISAGVLLGLAVTSQQFALLVAAPLLVMAPRSQRIRYAVAVIGSAGVVVIGMLVITNGRVMDVLTGTTATPDTGGTLLGLLRFHGVSLLFASRVLPIAFVMALAWWSARRLGESALDPVPLVSLIASSLCFRLVFEVNLFGYYFMALSVSLIVLNVIMGRFNSYLVAWLVLVTFAFDPLHWGSHPWTYTIPMASYQLLLVPTGLALAIGPLFLYVRDRNRSVLVAPSSDQAAAPLESILQSAGA
jgi:hypothetical protein